MNDCKTCKIKKCCTRKTVNKIGGYCWLEEYTKKEQNEIIEMWTKYVKDTD